MSDKSNFKILERFSEVNRFLPEIVAAADLHRHALGFFPESVFTDFARLDRIFVVVQIAENGQFRYVGHLMFSRRFPRAKILQMFILPEFRRNRLAEYLLEHLCEQLTQLGFISIYARVAEDLIDSNQFWQKRKFNVQRVEAGGVTRNRQILIRCRELDSPQLFPSSGIDATNPLGLASSALEALPLFLLDLNVLFDVAPRRRKHADAISLFQAERSNFCRLAISKEIREELRRTAHEGRTDPMEAYISIYPAYPLVEMSSTDKLLRNLAALIFAERFNCNTLSENDRSDLRHVATVIQNGLAGLITNDNAILRAATEIYKTYGVEVISPDVFKLEHDNGANTTFESLAESTLSLLFVTNNDEKAVREFLAKLKLSGSSIAAGWIPVDIQGKISICCGVWSESILVAYATWSPKEINGIYTARVAVDETSLHAFSAARILFIYMLDQFLLNGPRKIEIELPPNQLRVRELATSFGFSSSNDHMRLVKIAVGSVLLEWNWSKIQTELATKFSLRLPDCMPDFRNSEQQIKMLTPVGNQTHLSLDSLESLLAPALFCLRGRPAVLTPIWADFAAELLGSSTQGSLLPKPTASLFHDRHYISSAKTLRHFKKGALILFYESSKKRGRSAVVAIGRVREAYLQASEVLARGNLDHAVVTEDNLKLIGKSDLKTVTVFDNIFVFKKIVPLKILREIGCGEANQLITTQSITDLQVRKILSEAFGYE